jgi:hypothetical protein
MSTVPTPADKSADRSPQAPDRPTVDGTTMSPEELRAEVEWLSDERHEHIEEVRAALLDTLDELATRLDISGRLRARRALLIVTARRWSALLAGATALLIIALTAANLARGRRRQNSQ